MSRQLTDAELREPDVILAIPAGVSLPKPVGDLLFCYSGYLRKGRYLYKVPGYIARQVEQELRAAEQRVQSDGAYSCPCEDTTIKGVRCPTCGMWPAPRR